MDLKKSLIFWNNNVEKFCLPCSEVFYYKKGENFAVNFKTLDSKEKKKMLF